MTAVLSQAATQGLTAGGTVMMAVCILFVSSLCAYCYWRIFTEKDPGSHHHVPLDIDTHDRDT